MKNELAMQLAVKELPSEFKTQIFEYINKNKIQVEPKLASHKVDSYTKKLLLFLFTGTRGGNNRLRIALLLAKTPMNTHQIAKELGLDYKAIQFHLNVLEKNNMITRIGERYGTLFLLSTFLEHNIDAFNEIISKLHKDLQVYS